MALEDDIGILAGVAIFEEFTQEQLRLLAFGTERLKLSSGKELYREGARADCAYVVVSGTISLMRDTEDGRVSLSKHGPGAILGELALIADTRRLTGAVAASDAEVMRLNRALFRRILEEYPEVAAKLHRRLSENLSAMVSRIERLAPKFE